MTSISTARHIQPRFFPAIRRLTFLLLLVLALSSVAQEAATIESSTSGQGLPSGCGVNMTCSGLPGTGGGTGAGSGYGACTNNGAGSPCGLSSGPASQKASTTGQNLGVGNPLNVLSGNKYQVEVDMPPLPGVLGLEIVRHFNSQYARPNVPPGIFGRGWKLSYETDLYVVKDTVQIVQADGTRLIFNRDAQHPSVCATADPARGKVLVQDSPAGESFVWVWPEGRRLFFNVRGKLVQIVAPTGEFVSLTRDASGALVKVTDPQGRSLVLSYVDRRDPEHFHGVKAIDAPVGRFGYAYGSPLPAGADPAAAVQVKANLVSVALPSRYRPEAAAHPLADRGTTVSAVTRSYHYESPRHPTLLTGISVSGAGSDGVTMQVRLASWDYDGEARAILSLKGERPEGTETGVGTPATLRPPLQGEGRGGDGVKAAGAHREGVSGAAAGPTGAGAGPEEVRLAFPTPGTTVLTNSLGQTTTYRWAQIAGELRLLEALGPGCASCGPTNVRYGYDAQGRLAVSTRLDAAGKPRWAERVVRDAAGRVAKEERFRFVKGKPVPDGWVRYEYAPGPAAAGAAPAGSRAGDDTLALPDPKPLRIVRPSVVAGKTHTWAFTYNAAGQVLAVTEAGFAPALPDAAGNAKAGEPTPIERTTTYAYSTLNGRSVLASVDGPLPNGPKGDASDSDVTSFQWDRRGDFVTSVAAPGGFATTFRRDAAGRVSVRTVEDGGLALPAVRIEHAPRGQIVRVVRAEPPASKAPVSFWARAWQTVRGWFGGDAASAPELAVTITYDALDRPVRLTRPDGTWVEAAYDALGRPASVRDQDGNTVRRTLDSEGRQTALQWLAGAAEAPLDMTTHYAYDAADRLTRVEAPGGAVTELTYAPDAGLRAIRDALGRTVTFEMDALGRLREASLSAPGFGPVTLARFAGDGETGTADTTGRTDVPATTIVAGNGARARQAVDDFGRRVWVENADSGVQVARYDALDRLLEVADARGRVMRWQRNAAGQVLERTITGPGPDGAAATETTTFRYAGTRLIEVANAHQRTGFDYDAAGRLREKREQLIPVDGQTGAAWDFVTRYGYDALDRRVSESLPGGGTLHTAWSASGRPAGIDFVSPDGKHSHLLTDIRSSALTGVASFLHGNGLRTTLRQDPATGRLVELSVDEPAPPRQQTATGPAWLAVAHAATARTPVYGQTMDYDVLGRLTGIARISAATGARLEERFVFDALDRLQAASSPGETQAWAYDANGNRLAEETTTGTGAPIRAQLAYAPQSNRLVRTEAAGQETRLTYDATGNPLTVGARTLSYHPSGRLATVEEAGRPLARYAYNAAGLRVAKTTFGADGSPQTRYFLYDGPRLAAEIDSHGQVRAHYVHLGLAPVVKLEYAPQQINGPPGWFERVRGWLSLGAADGGVRVLAIHADHLGAPRRVTDEQRKTVWAADYAPFGLATVAPASTVSLELRFPGQIFDAETGTHYNGFREYDPQTGRYRSSDPLGIEAGLNTYAYVNGNPVQLVDPWGLSVDPADDSPQSDPVAMPWLFGTQVHVMFADFVKTKNTNGIPPEWNAPGTNIFSGKPDAYYHPTNSSTGNIFELKPYSYQNNTSKYAAATAQLAGYIGSANAAQEGEQVTVWSAGSISQLFSGNEMLLGMIKWFGSWYNVTLHVDAKGSNTGLVFYTQEKATCSPNQQNELDKLDKPFGSFGGTFVPGPIPWWVFI